MMLLNLYFEVCYENSMAEALKAMALEGHGAAWLPMQIATRVFPFFRR